MDSIAFDPADQELAPYPVASGRLSPGSEIAAVRMWEREDGSEIRGVWQMTPGVLEGVQADEMFVIQSGRATVEFSDGRIWRLSAGDVGITVPTDVARWIVHETVRKATSVRLR